MQDHAGLVQIDVRLGIDGQRERQSLAEGRFQLPHRLEAGAELAVQCGPRDRRSAGQ